MPVKPLKLSAMEQRRIRSEVANAFSKRGAAIRRAARLYSDFTGHDDVSVQKIRVPARPKTMLAIGQVDGILYSTVRDHVAERYIHEFKGKARPLLLASPDGTQLFLLGGAYDFTERGIVDRRTPRRRR